MKAFYIDVDVYMSGVLDIEFEDNSQDSGDTNIVFNMRRWMEINNPSGTMTMSELDNVVAEHKKACCPSDYYGLVAEYDASYLLSRYPMIVRWT